jgi:hypothetical protein
VQYENILSKNSVTVNTFDGLKIIFRYTKSHITIQNIMDAMKNEIKYINFNVKDYSLCNSDGKGLLINLLK